MPKHQLAEFYVGYQPAAPPALARFRRRIVIGLIAASLVLAGVLVTGQQAFPPSVFEFLEYREFEGVVEESPYPALLVKRPGTSEDVPEFSRYFLTVPGKRGAAAETAGLAGQKVRAEGALIYLDGQTMVELKHGGPEALKRLGDSPTGAAPVHREYGAVTLKGEIVDTKCYLGVMNPGRGKVHKACAIRCLSGGIPPGLLVRGESGGSAVVILAGGDGRQLNREVLEFVAEPIEIAGRLTRSGDTFVLYTEPSSFRRIE